MPRRVAIMQPYFMPYAGYFRLFASSDVFVIYDCVQFPRRGWLHRNKLPDHQGEAEWLTLPIKKAPQQTRICDLEFASNADMLWQEQFHKFPIFNTTRHPIMDDVRRLDQRPVDYICHLLELTCFMLDIPCHVVRSSTLNIPQEIKGEERIIAIAKTMDATDYINAPGGTELYDSARFAAENIQLHFLPDYKGNNWSMLYRLLSETPADIRKEIYAQC